MVSSTRSAKKNKDKVVGNSSKKKVANRKPPSNLSPEKADVLGLRRSARETHSSRLKTPSPQSRRKSERIEKQTPLPPSAPTTAVKNKKRDPRSPLRMLDKGKTSTTSSSSGSMRSGKQHSPLNVKKKEIKEKSLKKLNVESVKDESDPTSVGTKRKKMDARSYKALFKPQKIRYSAPDVAEELRRQDKQRQVNSREISSEPIGKSNEYSERIIEKLADESASRTSAVDISEKESEGNLLKLSSVHSGNEDPPQPSGGDGLRNRTIGSTIIDMLDDSKRAPKNCSSFKNAEFKNGSENDVQCIQPKGSVPLSSFGSDIHDLSGNCIKCFRKKRLDYYSPEEELCSCSATSKLYLNDLSKDRGDQEASICSESAGRCSGNDQLNKIHADYRTGSPQNVCVVCNQGGELLSCIGNGCKRCYHLSCLDPPLSDVPPGVWHCLWCVKKKIELGAHSVSQGVESVWNAREVEVSNAEGMRRQKQYLVKYHGLAHIHNQWVPEKQLLPHNYYHIAEFNSKHQVVKWNAEWTVPHRLLKKRPVMFSREQNKDQITPSIGISDCQYEWLVKWCGLGYEHSSWELDNSYALGSPRGQNLLKDHEIRLQKAKKTIDKMLLNQKESYVKLSKLTGGGSLPNSYNLLKHVNKLRWYWYNSQNAVVFDNQEGAMTMITFILSLSEVCQPFLVIVASEAISQWEAEFTRLAPSVAVTVYSGSRDTRKTIRTSEFYEEGGCMMLQVLLSSPEAVFEDLDMLRCIRWEAVIVDEFRHSEIENHSEQIKMLPTDSRILLFTGQLKDTVSEHLNLLSFLDCCDLDKFRGVKSDTIDNLGKLKERLSRFIAYGSIPELSKFVEYWVPVPLSNCQLEQYCATLLSNSIPLCSCSKSDPIGALRDILFTVRKCCDHPYLVNSSIQESLIAEGCLAQLLDTGIKVCGKLQLLDMILLEMKNQGQQVLILYQTIVGLGGTSIGDILDDFLRQRFGPNSYERIDSRVAPVKKQATVNRFNRKETGQFVFLLENRACSSSIKLSSVNIVIIYDSEWNPANDLRALQKITFDSKLERIKVFRLYSSCTLEEKALLLAKQVLNLDNNLQNLSRTTSDTLLVWGASYLFSKLDDYHADSSPASASDISSEQLLLHDTTKELLAILSGSCENNDSGCVISKAQLGVGRYSINLPLLGEGKFQLKDGEEAHIFWRKLLEGRNPRWKYSNGSTPRNRKRVKYFDGDTESIEVGKKRRKVGSESVDLASIQVEPRGHQITPAASYKGGSSTAITNHSQSLEKSTCLRTDNVNAESNFISGQRSSNPVVDVDKLQEIVTLSNEQKSLHNILKGEMARLCQILEVSEDVMHMVERFLEYVIKNHHVSNESPTIIQAFQISLFWITASILKQKIDKKDSLTMAKQSLNYGCTEEQANHVYSKMRLLKKMFLQCPENTKKSRKDCLLSTENVSKESCQVDAGMSQSSAINLQNLESGTERPANKEPSTDLMVSEHNIPPKDKVAECETEGTLKKIQKKCDKRMKKLIQKQEEEVQKFHRTCDEEREQLEKEHKLESACIRSIHGQGSVTIDKLKLLDSEFANKMEEHKRLKDMHVKELEANQLAAKNAERQKAARWLAKAKACRTEPKSVDVPLGSQSDDKVGCSETRAHITLSGHENAAPVIEQHTECTNLTEGLCVGQGNDIPLNTSVIAEAEAVGCTVPSDTAWAMDSTNVPGSSELISDEIPMLQASEVIPREVPEAVPEGVDHVHSVEQSDTAGAMDSMNLPGSSELISGEIPMLQASEVVPREVPEAVPEGVDHVNSVEQSDNSSKCNKGDGTGTDSNMPDVVNQRNANESVNGCLHSSEQSLLPRAETVASPDHCGSLTPSHVQLEGSVSGEIQSRDEPVPQDKSTLLVEVAISQHLHSETHVEPAPSNGHLSVNQSSSQVEVATSGSGESDPSVQSNHATAMENRELLQPVSIDASLSCDQTPESVECRIHDRERILVPETSCQLYGEQEAFPHQVTSQSGQELEQNPSAALVDSTLDRIHLDLGLVNRLDHVLNDELVASSNGNLSMSQAVVNTAQLSNQLYLLPQVDLSHASGSGNLTSQPRYQVPTCYPAPPLHAEPLQNELLRISKETEKELKVHEDLKKCLKSECEKEIQEAIAQIRDKYEAKLHDTETAFQLKKNELDKNHNKVLMNRILAEAFRSKCTPSGPPGSRQAMSPIFMHQLPVPHQTGHPAASSVGQPQTTVPTIQSSQQLLLSSIFVSSSTSQPRAVGPTVHSTGPATAYVSPSGSQPAANPTPAVQTVHQTSALFSGVPSRPPLISTITPSMGNLHIGEVRSPAPHLRPFRPSSSASGMPTQQAPPFRPATSPSLSQHTPQQIPHSQVPSLTAMIPISSNTVQLESHNASQSAVQLLMDMDQRPRLHGHNHNPFVSLPDLGATFGTLQQSDLETLGNNVQGSLPSPAATTDVVYLSDDD